jgi:hypothetical protein
MARRSRGGRPHELRAPTKQPEPIVLLEVVVVVRGAGGLLHGPLVPGLRLEPTHGYPVQPVTQTLTWGDNSHSAGGGGGVTIVGSLN